MNNIVRTVQDVIEVDLLINKNIKVESLATKKVFQLVKHVTGKNKNDHTDYVINNTDDWNGYQTVTIAGKLGFIRVALTPLFEII